MAKVESKEILQSYIITTAKYNFNVHEKRIMYRIIELNQYLIEGKQLNKDYSYIKNSLGDMTYTMPISAFLKSDENNNHKEVKKAFESLQKKIITYEDNTIWASLSIIANPKIIRFSNTITFTVDKMINDAFLNFSKGYKKYELQIAMGFESIYSMRFYELLSNQKTPINYSIESLKEMFELENKYSKINDFFKRVIEPAKKELDRCSPYTFHYEPLKTARKITGVRLIPVHQPQFDDPSIKQKSIMKQASLSWIIPKNIEDYLVYNFEFTIQELKNNISLLEVIGKSISENELLDFLVEIKGRSVFSDNPKGFLIGALKKKSEQMFEEKYLKK